MQTEQFLDLTLRFEYNSYKPSLSILHCRFQVPLGTAIHVKAKLTFDYVKDYVTVSNAFDSIETFREKNKTVSSVEMKMISGKMFRQKLPQKNSEISKMFRLSEKKNER